MRRSSSRALVALLVARATTEAIAFACFAALAHAAGGSAPLAVTPTTLALVGVTLVLVAILRETGSERRGTAVVVGTLGAGVLAALLLPTQPLDLVGRAGRIIGFVILAEVYLWRIVSLSHGAIRWSDARNALPFSAAALMLAAVVPVPLDRAPLVPLALVLVGASAIALSLARSTEELSLTKGPAGPARATSANSVVFAVGLGAVIAAAIAPFVDQLLGDLGRSVGPILDEVLFYMLLPLGYLSALIFELIAPLLRGINLSFLPRAVPRSPEQDEALLREIERTRPLVFGGFELLIAVVVVLVALVLFERAVRERRLVLPEGSELERAAISGLSLRETLRSLFPMGRGRRRPPSDDGTASAALRLVYWRLLALAERSGLEWRGSAETPGEHQRRLAAVDARWAAAAPIVVAFEDLRYGEQAPDRATVARARETLRAVEVALRT